MRSPEDLEHERWIREVLADFERPLLAYATRLLGGDLEAARDLVQDTFLRLCRTPRSEVDGALRAWLFTVCRNRALDVLRKERPMRSLEPEHAEQLASVDAPPGAALETRDDVQRTLAALASLPSEQREVLRLKFQHGLSYAEIARVTKRKQGTVGWLIHEGIRSLRARLEPDEVRGAEA